MHHRPIDNIHNIVTSIIAIAISIIFVYFRRDIIMQEAIQILTDISSGNILSALIQIFLPIIVLIIVMAFLYFVFGMIMILSDKIKQKK